MRSFARSLVMWLIALAIPVHGMAALVVPMCPPAHHEHGSPPPPGVAGHHATPTPASLVVDHAAEHGAGPAHHHATAHDETGHAGHSMLECCSAAGAMSGLSAPSLPARVPACSAAQPHAVAPLHLGVTPDGLDRPPKPILA